MCADACTTDFCVAGVWENDAIICDDGNDRTDDFCDSVTGCEAMADDSNSCSDGDDCTVNDTCSSGSCTGDDSTEPDCMCLPRNASCQSDSECCDARCRGGRCR